MQHCELTAFTCPLLQALFFQRKNFPKPFSLWTAQFLLLTEPGGLMSQQRPWARDNPEQPGHWDRLCCQSTVPLSKHYWKYLHFPGLVLQNPKGEQSSFKNKDSLFEDRSCFMLPYVFLFTSPFARWILFACLVIKVVWTECNSESHCGLVQSIQLRSNRCPFSTCKSLSLQESLL